MRILRREALLVLATMAMTALAITQSTCAAEECDVSSECSLYLAPSTKAGLGLFTSKTISRDTIVGNDTLITTNDYYKTLPYRGHEGFLSWLAYVWPVNPNAFYHTYADEYHPLPIPHTYYQVNEGLNTVDGHDLSVNGKRVSAFSPGVASCANSDPTHANVQLQQVTSNETTHHGVTFYAMQDIPAGSELLMNYGRAWHWHLEELKNRNSSLDFPTLQEFASTLDENDISTEKEKRDYLQEQQDERMELQLEIQQYINEVNERMNEYPDEAERLEEVLERLEEDLERAIQKEENIQAIQKSMKATYPQVEAEEENGAMLASEVEKDEEATNRLDETQMQDEEAARRKVSKQTKEAETLVKEKQDEQNLEEAQDEGDTQEKAPQGPVTPEWLEQNGVCVDHLRPGKSTVDGMGAFASHFLPSGSVIAPAPLLAIKRDDLVIYEADDDAENLRDVLDFDSVVGHELLLNYCYGHPDSELLLLPYSPVVNYINHNGKKPNAKIRWPNHTSLLGDPSNWLDLHPVDVLQMSGKIMMEFVALRDIEVGEEIFIDYGQEWEQSWKEHDSTGDDIKFRHEIGIPAGFFPDNWLNQSVTYEVAPLEAPLKSGEFSELTWAHNGKRVMKSAYKVGLPEGFSHQMLEYSNQMGITDLYKKLLYDNVLDSEDFFVFETHGEQWFAQHFHGDWNFNMHYVAAWDEAARQGLFRALGKAGFDVVLESLAHKFNLDNVTCIHASFMGVSECDQSKEHTDIYATDDKFFNIVFPLMVVNGSKPELDIIGENANIQTSINYEYDVAVVMGDWGYHKTSPITYDESGQMRIVMGMYCGQLDDSNAKVLAHIYDGEDPAPFMSQFDRPNRVVHWSHDGHRLPK